jgi:hypothetical protein
MLEDQMRNTIGPVRLALLLSIGGVIASANMAAAQGSRQLFTNEQLTLACQHYVNALYPASQGSMDRSREAVFRACLKRKGR